MAKALFIDRDGTLIEHKPYLHKAEDVALVGGTRESLIKAAALGYKLFMITNQSGVGRDMFTMDDVESVHERMSELLELPDPIFANICIAPESPHDIPVYRKPSPKFIHEMIEEYELDPQSCYMIGDNHSDIMTGINAGIHAVLVESGISTADEHQEISSGQAQVFASFSAFVDWLAEQDMEGRE